MRKRRFASAATAVFIGFGGSMAGASLAWADGMFSMMNPFEWTTMTIGVIAVGLGLTVMAADPMAGVALVPMATAGVVGRMAMAGIPIVGLVAPMAGGLMAMAPEHRRVRRKVRRQRHRNPSEGCWRRRDQPSSSLSSNASDCGRALIIGKRFSVW
jgi:hypothetical protein